VDTLVAEGVEWVPLRLPKRPFLVLFAAFYIVGGIRVALARQGALVHAVGALVPNRIDVATVQFVHRAAPTRPPSRNGRLFEANAFVARRVSRAAETWSYRRRRTSVLAAVSHGIVSELDRTLGRDRPVIEVIPNGVDPATFKPDRAARARVRTDLGLNADDLVGVFAGGDWYRKGLPVAIEALALAQNWHLLVVGTGPEVEFRGRAEAVGALDRVHFVGHRTDPEAYMAAGDAFVFPTSYEAFPLVVLEAAATALPLVCTPVNGAEEIVRDGETGVRIEPNALSIAAALGQLETGHVRAQLGDGARSASEAYSWTAVVDAYETLYARTC
jgi:UDP-glucose:(heptosyl)LPS alpha-1,3-glucosyltransferase